MAAAGAVGEASEVVVRKLKTAVAMAVSAVSAVPATQRPRRVGGVVFLGFDMVISFDVPVAFSARVLTFIRGRPRLRPDSPKLVSAVHLLVG